MDSSRGKRAAYCSGRDAARAAHTGKIAVSLVSHIIVADCPDSIPHEMHLERLSLSRESASLDLFLSRLPRRAASRSLVEGRASR